MKLKKTVFFSDKFLIELDKIQLKNFSSTSKQPTISVVMPSFNHEKYIERSILSILNQDYKNIQLVIIDGGSKDGTVNIIKKYEKYIDYWISEKDNGQSDALNKGFEVCKGDYFCWLNSDDLFLPGTFSKVVEIFKKNLLKKICFGDWISINDNDQYLDYHYAFDINLDHLKYEGFHLNAQSLFWHKEVHNKFSGFDIKLNKTMDYQMILEFASNHDKSEFIRINKVLGAFRRYVGQKTGKYSNEEHHEHKYLASKYNYDDKYLLIGTFKRFFFRFRRALWYFKRGGVKELLKRIFK